MIEGRILLLLDEVFEDADFFAVLNFENEHPIEVNTEDSRSSWSRI